MFVRLFLKAVFLLLLLQVAANPLSAQSTSNKGKDFWLGYGNHVRGFIDNSQKMAVYITSDVSTSGKVEIPGIGYSAIFNVTANSITTVIIPQSAYLQGEGLYNRGIHITAVRPVVIYAHIFNQNVSGATLVLPVAALGKEYYSINYTQISNQENSFSYFFVVAVEDNTQVEITPSAATQSHPAGKPFIINLKKGEVYQVLGRNTFSLFNSFSRGVDLTGSTIRSITTTMEPCKRIAVFSGSGKIAIGCGEDGSGTSDNLYQQLYPTNSWGKKFITAPLSSRNYDIFRILKSDASAIVKLNGEVINNIDFTKNIYYEFSSQTTNVIESDKPIQVVQYAVTQRRTINCSVDLSDIGDPEMITLNSVEQNIDNITVFSSPAFLISSHFINVIIESSAAASFKIDGVPATFTKVPADPAYSVARISVSSGVHNLKADKGFNAIAYGFGAAESYGYSAGANVKSLGVELETRVTNIKTTNGCVYEPLRFKVTLPYKATKLIWDLNDSSSVRTVSKPIESLTYVLNDVLYYVYELDEVITYAEARDYSVSVIAEKSLVDGCGSSEQLFFDFSIFNSPLPDFSFSDTICSGQNAEFVDKSNGQGRSVTTWLWNFGDTSSGDNNVSNLQTAGHVFSAAGTYKITLTITNESNCAPVTISHDVLVLNKPEARFSSPEVVCENIPAVFEDQSELNGGSITKWIWDFGDGQTSTDKNPIHIYSKPGVYEVILTTEGEKSCVSDPAKKTITVNSLPVANFKIPQICLTDAVAIFTDQSVVADGVLDEFTYSWDFGDQNATSQNPNTSALENPEHVFTAVGTYNIRLTLKTAGGCETSILKLFTVNGSVPKSEFNVLNPDKLCSNKTVVFEDNAKVDFGEITRIEWVFDLANNPENIVVDSIPNKRGSKNKVYEHLYPAFTSPATKSYLVKMLAYSGIVCVDEQIKEIVLGAQPQLFFDSLGVVCIDKQSFSLTQGTVTNNIAGRGTYSGAGVTDQGEFNPLIAGTGLHTITYNFISVNGCTETTTQTIEVTGMPVADAGPDQFILEGGSIVLPATSTGGFNFKYKWTPSIGLDKDDVLNPIVTALEDITYILTVSAGEDCASADEVIVKVLKAPVVPNAFTPNNDGVNDEWNIKYLNSYPAVVVKVFNRFGNKVYTSVGYTEAWKGKFNGTDLPVGTYFYVIDPGEGRKTITGSVTIIR
ncbi:MAG: PKD domain-containing protein [Flavobacterium sp.]|nr:PKD domain-containing protein [Pedobacter sp.]